MPSAAVFLDTSALIALSARDDALHSQACRVRDELTTQRIPYLVTDWVLTEFLSAMSSPPCRGASIALVDRLQASRRTTIIPATRESWESAFRHYRDRPDKAWSLVDCGSILVCQERGISRVFTHDHHFRQAGLETLL